MRLKLGDSGARVQLVRLAWSGWRSRSFWCAGAAGGFGVAGSVGDGGVLSHGSH